MILWIDAEHLRNKQYSVLEKFCKKAEEIFPNINIDYLCDLMLFYLENANKYTVLTLDNDKGPIKYWLLINYKKTGLSKMVVLKYDK